MTNADVITAEFFAEHTRAVMADVEAYWFVEDDAPEEHVDLYAGEVQYQHEDNWDYDF